MKFTILLSCRHMHYGAKNLMCVMLLFVIGSLTQRTMLNPRIVSPLDILTNIFYRDFVIFLKPDMHTICYQIVVVVQIL